MTSQMDVERTEEPKQLQFKLAYGTLLASLLVGWAACFYSMLSDSDDSTLDGVLWTICLVGMAVSIVFMWRAYDRNNDYELCKKFGVAFLVLNLVVFGVSTLVAWTAREKYDGENEDKKIWNAVAPLFWTLAFAGAATMFSICGFVAMCVFPKPRPASFGFEAVPSAV